MSVELQVGMLMTAITALAGVVTKLWLSLEKRTDAQLAAFAEHIRVIAALQTQIQLDRTSAQAQLAALEQRMGGLASDIREDLAHLTQDAEQTRNNVMRHHSEHGAILHEIRATLIERQRLGHDPLGQPAPVALHARGEGE